MKNSLDQYERMLFKYLSDNNFPEAEDYGFIASRADEAAEAFNQARLNGKNVTEAQEIAIQTLIADLNGETFDELVRGILENYSPEEGYDFFIADMEERLEDLRERYTPGEYPVYSAEYDAFKTDLLGVIDDYFTTYLPL